MVGEIKCAVCSQVAIEPFAMAESADSRIYMCSRRCLFDLCKTIKEDDVKKIKNLFLYKSRCIQINKKDKDEDKKL